MFASSPALQVVENFAIGFDDSGFGTGLYCHIAQCEAISHRKLVDSRAGKFKRTVERALHTKEANSVENHVLSSHHLRNFPFINDPHCCWNLEPIFAQRPRSGHVGAADAGRKSTKSSVCAGVRISADDEVAGHYESTVWHNAMTDTRPTHFEVIFDLIFHGKFPHRFRQARGADILRRHEVVIHKCNSLVVEHPVGTDLIKNLNCKWHRHVCAHNEVYARVHKLAGSHGISSGVRCKDFLRDRHAHGAEPPLLNFTRSTTVFLRGSSR